MTDKIYRLAEERFGIRADELDLEKFHAHLLNTYGPGYEGELERVFRSGEAAAFLTVNETYFFREPDHFTFLNELLPSCSGSLRICSAASSIGCEAYSIAALLENYNRKHAPGLITYHIDAFDINPRVIETAKKGRYGKNSLREDGSAFHHLLDPYLKKEDGAGNIAGNTGGAYTVEASLKKNIHFFVYNVFDILSSSYDIIFFRNAFIYFSPRNRFKLLSSLASSLAEGGYLIMGVSETAAVRHPLLKGQNRGDVFYFRKKSDAGSAREDDPPPSRLTESFSAADVNAPPPSSSNSYLLNKGLTGNALANKAAKRLPRPVLDPALVERYLSGEAAPAPPVGAVPKMAAENRDINELAAAVVFFLDRGDFSAAAGALAELEGIDAEGPPAQAFLRGEFFYLQDRYTEAEFHYKICLGKNNGFWPAQYRLYSLNAPTGSAVPAGDAAAVRREYRASAALEGIAANREARYEVFIGGFSPDYYAGVLHKAARKEAAG